MTIGERLKKIRMEKGMTVDVLADRVGISRATLYRYESEFIKKIPVEIMEKLCQALGIQPYELLQDGPSMSTPLAETSLDSDFRDPQEAMAFLLKLPSVAAFGGYDISKMRDEDILEFANEILHQIEMFSFKYR